MYSSSYTFLCMTKSYNGAHEESLVITVTFLYSSSHGMS